MKSTWFAAVFTLIISMIFWAVVSWMAGVAEPWDACCFFTLLYPMALALTLALGRLFSQHAWLSGVIVMFAQVPYVLVTSGAGPLLAVGMIYAFLLSIPAMVLSCGAGVLYRRWVG